MPCLNPTHAHLAHPQIHIYTHTNLHMHMPAHLAISTAGLTSALMMSLWVSAGGASIVSSRGSCCPGDVVNVMPIEFDDMDAESRVANAATHTGKVGACVRICMPLHSHTHVAYLLIWTLEGILVK